MSRQLTRWIASVMLLAAIGCAAPAGRTGGRTEVAGTLSLVPAPRMVDEEPPPAPDRGARQASPHVVHVNNDTDFELVTLRFIDPAKRSSASIFVETQDSVSLTIGDDTLGCAGIVQANFGRDLIRQRPFDLCGRTTFSVSEMFTDHDLERLRNPDSTSMSEGPRLARGGFPMPQYNPSCGRPPYGCLETSGPFVVFFDWDNELSSSATSDNPDYIETVGGPGRRPSRTPAAATQPPQLTPPANLSSCQYGSDQVCREVDVFMANRPYGRAFIIAPSSVDLDQEFILRVELDPSRQRTTAEVRAANPSRQVQARNVRWTRTMSAHLEPGASFTAVPQFDDPIQNVSPNELTTWTWRLKAVQAGDQIDPIVIRLRAYFYRADGTRTAAIPVDVLRHQVTINVPWWHAAGSWVSRLQPIYSFIAVICGAGLAGLTWYRKRRKAGTTAKARSRKRKSQPQPSGEIASAV